MYRLTRTSAAAPIPLDTFPTVSYPRAEVEETETKVRPVSTEKENTDRLGMGEGSTPACKEHREANAARSGQQAHWRCSKGRKQNPVTLCEPGDSAELHPLGVQGPQESLSFSTHGWGELVQREEGSIQGHLANKRKTRDQTQVS